MKTPAMKPQRKVISDVRRNANDIEMADRDWRTIFVLANASLPEMVAEGVRDIGLSPFGEPKRANRFYSGRDIGITGCAP